MTGSKNDHFRTLSEVEPEKIEWLWHPIIPYGMITIMEGDPGVGKSYLAMHMAAQVSSGGSLPDGTKLRRGKVLYLSAEDDPAYTIRPRIDAMGGDPDRIRYQSRYSAFDDEGLKILWKEVRSTAPTLIIIDPLYAFVPSAADMYKPNEIRALLFQISEIATYAGSAMLIVKYNLSRRGDSWMYRLLTRRAGQLPVLQWAGKTDLTADELLNPSHNGPSAAEAAIDFLREKLSDGPKAANDLINLAKSAGIAKRTLDRAKKTIGVIVRKREQRWFWELAPKE